MLTEADKTEAAIAHMAETAKNWSVEEFASRTVGLLIHDKGNLNNYARTLELVFKVHERVVAARALQSEERDTNG